FGKWEVTGPEGYVMNETHFQPNISSPQATFAPLDSGGQPMIGNFTLKFTMTFQPPSNSTLNPTPPSTCSYTAIELNVFVGCAKLDFDGINDFVDLGEAYTGDYSIEAWIRPFARNRADGTKTDPAKGTIISTPQLEINMGDLIDAGVKIND